MMIDKVITDTLNSFGSPSEAEYPLLAKALRNRTNTLTDRVEWLDDNGAWRRNCTQKFVFSGEGMSARGVVRGLLEKLEKTLRYGEAIEGCTYVPSCLQGVGPDYDERDGLMLWVKKPLTVTYYPDGVISASCEVSLTHRPYTDAKKSILRKHYDAIGKALGL